MLLVDAVLSNQHGARVLNAMSKDFTPLIDLPEMSVMEGRPSVIAIVKIL